MNETNEIVSTFLEYNTIPVTYINAIETKVILVFDRVTESMDIIPSLPARCEIFPI